VRLIDTFVHNVLLYDFLSPRNTRSQPLVIIQVSKGAETLEVAMRVVPETEVSLVVENTAIRERDEAATHGRFEVACKSKAFILPLCCSSSTLFQH
jgi:hypothetical protein